MITACTECGTVTSDGQPNDMPALPGSHEQRGGDPSLVGKELLHLITEHIDRNPRSLQTAVGPSELGTPCKRKLAYKLLNHPEINTGDPAWFPTIGTAVHTWLEQMLTATNDSSVIDRFYLEERVTIGQVGGEDVSGSCDVYDRVTATIVDWKIVGDTALAKYKKNGPGDQYRRQAHLYGRGFQLRGLPVDTVSVMFLPRNKMLHHAHYWHEPYDEQIALDTLATADTIHGLITAGGIHALPLIPTSDDHCTYCPYRQQGSTDPSVACPGETSYAETHQAPATLADALN